MRKFHIASDEDIKSGETSDVYYLRTKKILEAKGLASTKVVAEATVSSLPKNWHWCVICGIEEEAHLFEGLPVSVYSVREGTVVPLRDIDGLKIPVMRIEGAYAAFAHVETASVGLLCQATGVATAAARVKIAAGWKPVYAFGIRRMHPAIAPMLDRAAFIGGFDGVSGVLGAKLIGIKPSGTMPHTLILIFGNQEDAWKAFDEVIEQDIPRVALVDTFYDEKVEALMAAKLLKDKLFAVRLDTHGSRRGNFADIIREVRWELDINGFKNVKIMVSGGLNDENIGELSKAGADIFGVGTSVSNAPTVDFAIDIVEVEGKPLAKRGKLAGKKQVWRCRSCFTWKVTLANTCEVKCPRCGDVMDPVLEPLVEEGRIVKDLPKPQEIRDYVISQIKHYNITL